MNVICDNIKLACEKKVTVGAGMIYISQAGKNRPEFVPELINRVYYHTWTIWFLCRTCNFPATNDTWFYLSSPRATCFLNMNNRNLSYAS